MKTKNYLPLLRAMEQVRDFAMNFSVRTENGEGEKIHFKISGIRISYLEYQTAQLAMVNGVSDTPGGTYLQALPACPEVLITLFYQNQRKQVSVSHAFSEQALKNPATMQSLLRSILRKHIVELVQLFYATKLSKARIYSEDQSNPMVLPEEDFEIPAFQAYVPMELHESLLSLNRDCYLADPIVQTRTGLACKRKLWMVVDSWGTRVIDYQDSVLFSLTCTLYNKKKKLNESDSVFRQVASLESLALEMPGITSEVQTWISSLGAKQLQSDIYPLLFAPSAVGVLFHEALAAHMLSGNYIAHGISTVFAKKIGKQIASDEFMSCLRELEIWDCPSDHTMSASYRYDMEGVSARDVCLINHGVVKNYLHDRNSAAMLKMKNNGHALAGGFTHPIQDAVVCEPRISNLKVLSDSQLTLDDLKNLLLTQFGYYLWVESHAGVVNIETGTFDLRVSRILKVEASGKQTWYSGGVFSSNLTDFLSAIQVVSNHYGSAQGMCGAMSGWVPTEHLAPAMMVHGVNWVPDTSEYEQQSEQIDYDPRKEKYIPASWEQKVSSFEVGSIAMIGMTGWEFFSHPVFCFFKKKEKSDFDFFQILNWFFGVFFDYFFINFRFLGDGVLLNAVQRFFLQLLLLCISGLVGLRSIVFVVRGGKCVRAFGNLGKFLILLQRGFSQFKIGFSIDCCFSCFECRERRDEALVVVEENNFEESKGLEK